MQVPKKQKSWNDNFSLTFQTKILYEKLHKEKISVDFFYSWEKQ